MVRIGLIVTGETEQLALAESLGAVFPDAELRVARRVDGFTGGDPLQALDARPRARSKSRDPDSATRASSDGHPHARP